MLFNECTGLINKYVELNKVFVKDEILTRENLLRLGFKFQDEKLYSVHKSNEADAVLSNLIKKIKDKEISTRKNRGKAIEVLDAEIKELLKSNKEKEYSELSININQASVKEKPIKETKVPAKKQTARTHQVEIPVFGKKLYLESGEVSNLYRDIIDLYEFYKKNKKELSNTFPSLIRMSLRLLCETAAQGKNQSLNQYIKNNFSVAKQRLSKDQKTTLHNQNINENSLVALLHTGAHNYTSSSNLQQTLAISIILGEILTNTYGKDV